MLHLGLVINGPKVHVIHSCHNVRLQTISAHDCKQWAWVKYCKCFVCNQLTVWDIVYKCATWPSSAQHDLARHPPMWFSQHLMCTCGRLPLFIEEIRFFFIRCSFAFIFIYFVWSLMRHACWLRRKHVLSFIKILRYELKFHAFSFVYRTDYELAKLFHSRLAIY